MSEHQKVQKRRKELYEEIEEVFSKMKQKIIDEDTYKQVKQAFQEFKENRELRGKIREFYPKALDWVQIIENRLKHWELSR